MNSIKTILLTGSNGMVGKNILEFYKAKDYIFISPAKHELNLLDKAAIDCFLAVNKVDLVIHAAGSVGGIKANIENSVKFLIENSYMGLNLITSCRENGITKVINLASSCMYPRNVKSLLKEEMILQGELEPTNEGYALAKILSTKACEYISKTCQNLFYKTIIPCNLYGKYDKFDLDNAHMIPAVIAKMHYAKINNIKEVEIWGDGKARREFMYAGDLADFIFYAIENFDALPQNINVGIGEDYTIDEYYSIVAKIVGYAGSLTYDFSKPVGMQRKLMDITRINNLSWRHKISLEDGIKRTYEYYLSKF